MWDGCLDCVVRFCWTRGLRGRVLAEREGPWERVVIRLCGVKTGAIAFTCDSVI